MDYLEELLQKDCPFEPWQFIEAKMVLDWLWNNVTDKDLQKWHMGNVHERLDYYLFHYAYNKMRLKPICKCSTEELESELKRRRGE